MSSFSVSKLAIAVASVGLLQTSLPGFAQDSSAILPEIVVTAQKREENLSDVPLSISVANSARLDATHITRIAELTEIVPNFTMTETGISTQMFIRGIGSGNNQAFEQSVGQYIDGVYYGRQQLIRAPFFDLERVEVLRGPQGILFGKNSIAGALNLTSAKPTDEFEASIKGLYEFEAAQKEINAVISGPLSDNFRARLAYRGYQEDGYVRNTYKNTDEPQRDEDAVRLILDWDISEGLNASLKVEHDSFSSVGRQIEVVRDDPNLFPAGSTPIAGLNFGQIIGAFGEAPMEANQDFIRQADAPESNDTNVDNITLNINYDLAGNNLTLISSFLEYDYHQLCECDYTVSNTLEAIQDESYEQFSQEIRLTSPSNQPFEWIVGAYYQSNEMNSLEDIIIPTDSLFGTLAATSSDPGVQSLVAILGTTARRVNKQESDAWAVFAQASFEFADDFKFTIGARYTEEDKDATRRFDAIDSATQEITKNPLTPLVFLGAFDIYTEQAVFLPPALGGPMPLPGHNLNGSRNEDSFTPMANLQWHATDSTMLYASYSTGFKAGGFDARANNPFSFEFENEEATTFEIGSKSLLLNGAFELNTAIFFTDYDDLQIAQFDGTLGFNVGNAKETEVKGIEIDGRWAASDHLTVGYAYAFLDFEFTDFTNGNCYNRQVPDGDVVNGVALCDYTGSSGKYTPKNTFNLFFDYVRPLSNGLELFTNLNINFAGEQNIHDNLDPNFVISSVTKVNLRLGLQTDNWSVAFIGRNLTDESVLTYSANAPISANLFGTNTFYAFVERPRQIAVEAAYRF